ncbi:transposase [Chromatiales bacterium (ex Bugula neritina AB1)]|nr:transposase [Chromatiales bacterium (ex Bugula neritina AB1)]
MRAKFTQSFKIQAVEKALSRNDVTSLKDIAESLGVGHSTLHKWIVQSRHQAFESISNEGAVNVNGMAKEKRPQDWSPEDKLGLIIRCGALSDEDANRLCREQGLYPHHIQQWKEEFVGRASQSPQTKNTSEAKHLRHENKALKKELNRKDKALAETAALLVLQKKVNAIWGDDEDSSQ